MDTEVIAVEIAKLDVRAGDTLVARLRGPQSAETIARCTEHLKSVIAEGVNVLVIDGRIDLSVIRRNGEAGPEAA